MIVVFTYLGFTKFANPFANQFTVHATFSSANGLRPASLGADRRRRRRQGAEHPGRARLPARVADAGPVQRRRRDDRRSTSRGCRSTRTRRSRSARASSWRATSSSTSVRARRRRRPPPTATRSRPAGRRAGPARPGADHRCRPTPARTCRSCSSSTARRSSRAARRYNALDPVLAGRLQVHVDRRPRRARDPAPRPVELDRRAGQRSPERSTPPAEPPEPGHRLQHHRHTRSRARTWRSRTRVAELPKTLSAAIPAFNAAQRRVPARADARHGADPGRRSPRARDRREPAVHNPAEAARAAIGAGRAGVRSRGHDPGARDLTGESIPLMRNGVRPASSCLANVVLPVVAADAERPELQRLQRLPAAQGVRRGRRLPARTRRRVARRSTPTAPTSAYCSRPAR